MRKQLTRDAVVDAAVAVADAGGPGGLAGVSMRSVARELGVEAMSLYHHVAGKEALLDALADRVFDQLEVPTGDHWRSAMTARARSQREVLTRHPWGLGLIESRRSAGPAVLHHHDAVIGFLLGAGFGLRLAAHAFSVLDAYVFGFVLTEVHLPFTDGESADEVVGAMALSADDFPHLARMAQELVVGHDYSYGVEFEPGLDLILDALARRLGEQ